MTIETGTLYELLADYDKYAVENQYPKTIDGLYKSINHIMSMKSKRIRPLLAMISNQAFNGEMTDVLPVAHAIETFHNFTLVHDDIMDNSEIRRGNPCVHVKYGIEQAILGGDAMVPYTYNLLLEVPNNQFKEQFKVFNQTAWEIMEGQQMDIEFENRNDVQLTEYLKMISLKTSVLLACACKMGAISANASEKDQESLYQFGLNLGLAFQIKDDYLDSFGEGDKVGKRIGGDILNNKKTFLMISALERANDAQKAQLAALENESNEDKKIEETLQLFEELNVKSICSEKMEALFKVALNELKNVENPSFDKTLLEEVAHIIYFREF